MTTAMLFPSPIAFYLGDFPVRWYGLSYGLGILLAWVYGRFYVLKHFPKLSLQDLDDFVSWGILGIIVGGRLGHVILYNPSYYWQFPWKIAALWQGGMSFHGGFCGVMAASVLYCKHRRISLLEWLDVLACCCPIGLFLGRMANFINQELWGRVTSVKWGVVFPLIDPHKRHPSQIYEAFMEGICLFFLLWALLRWTSFAQQKGRLSAVFCLGYGTFRWVAELFREPEQGPLSQAWFMDFITLGQLYTIPIVMTGMALWVFSPRRSS